MARNRKRFETTLDPYTLARIEILKDTLECSSSEIVTALVVDAAKECAVYTLRLRRLIADGRK